MPLKDQLVRAEFNGVVFPVLDVRDQRENTVAEHRAYRVDGANLEHTGRGPLRVSLRAAFINSLLSGGWPTDMFPGQHDLLESEFLERPSGVLTHPFYGRVRGTLVKFERALDPSVQEGAFVDLEFLETNASAEAPPRVAEQEPGAALLEAAEAADASIEALALRAPPAPLAPVVEGRLAYLEDAERGTAEAAGALAEVRRAALALLDGSALAGIEGHAARGQLRAVVAASWAYATRYLTPKPRSRTFVVPAPTSLARAAARIYGDPSKAHLLRRANVLADELRIPAGTVLSVPDDE